MATKQQTKPKPARPPRPKKPKQGFLPDMAPPSVPEIDVAADHYFDVMMERVRLSKEEDEAKDNLLEKMLANKMTSYETPDGLTVTMLSKSLVKCKKKTQAEEGEAA